MRGIVRCVLAAVVVATSAVAGPADTSLAAAKRSLTSVITSVLPSPDQVVGVAHPVVVTFGAPIIDKHAAERTLNITSSPAMTGKYEWLDSQVVHWTPDEFWPAHSTVSLSVGGVPTRIVTGAAVVAVANIEEHTFTVTIDGSEAGPPPILPAPHHRPHFGEPGVFPASMGREQYPTPVGTFPVLSKSRDVVMDSSSVGIPVSSEDGYLLTVDHAVRLTTRGIFVHSAPWAENSMGYENTSHGCIGLSPHDAEWYFDVVKEGDPVIVQQNSVEIPRPVEPKAPVEVPRIVSG